MDRTFVPLERFGHHLGIPAKWLRAEVDAHRLPSLIVAGKVFVPAIVEGALVEHCFKNPGKPLEAPLELAECEAAENEGVTS